MGIMDNQLMLSESQDITANSGSSTDSEDWILIPQVKDHTGTSRNDRPNVSGRNHLNIVVEDVDFAGAGAVVTFELFADSDATNITTDGDVILTKVVTVGTDTLVDGSQIMSVPLPNGTFKPYLQLKAGVATANLTAGSITASIGPALQQGGEHGAL